MNRLRATPLLAILVSLLVVVGAQAQTANVSTIRFKPRGSDNDCVPARWELWANSVTGKFRACENGVLHDLLSSGGAGDVLSAGKAGGQIVSGDIAQTASKGLLLRAESSESYGVDPIYSGAAHIWLSADPDSGSITIKPSVALLGGLELLSNSGAAGLTLSWNNTDIGMFGDNLSLSTPTNNHQVNLKSDGTFTYDDAAILNGGNSTLASLPATCTVGQVWVTTDTTKVCGCTATNTWKCTALS